MYYGTLLGEPTVVIRTYLRVSANKKLFINQSTIDRTTAAYITVRIIICCLSKIYMCMLRTYLHICDFKTIFCF